MSGRSAAHLADEFQEIGYLTQRQALAWVLVDVEDLDQRTAADRMDIERSTLRGLLSTAREKIDVARDTVGLADDVLEDE
jgi:predicted DNA-binding protein (UPF0251 family)